MIAILDLGMGNLRSVQKAFEFMGYNAFLTSSAPDVEKAKALVFPGVGAFGDCMKFLEEKGLLDAVISFIGSGRPYLGICLGMQVLFEESEEFGKHKGLGVIKGKVVRFPDTVGKIPHMGWNSVDILKKHPVLEGIKNGDYFYFVHSYYCSPEEDVVATVTEYGGIRFCSSVTKENVFACQFHPEKSQKLGLKVVRNFGEMVKEGKC